MKFRFLTDMCLQVLSHFDKQAFEALSLNNHEKDEARSPLPRPAGLGVKRNDRSVINLRI